MNTLDASTQELTGTRFGNIAYEELDVLTFPDGLVGFRDWHHFVIVNHKEGSPFRWLQSIDEPAFAMLMVDPKTYDSQYQPKIPANELSALGLSAEDIHLTFVTVSIPVGSPQDMTLNMAGPIIVNPANRQASQVILPVEMYNTRQRAFPIDEGTTGESAA